MLETPNFYSITSVFKCCPMDYHRTDVLTLEVVVHPSFRFSFWPMREPVFNFEVKVVANLTTDIRPLEDDAQCDHSIFSFDEYVLDGDSTLDAGLV